MGMLNSEGDTIMDYFENKTIEYCGAEIILIKLLKNVTEEEKRQLSDLFEMPTIDVDSFFIKNLFLKYKEEINQGIVTIENLEEWQEFKKKKEWDKNLKARLSLVIKSTLNYFSFSTN